MDDLVEGRLVEILRVQAAHNDVVDSDVELVAIRYDHALLISGAEGVQHRLVPLRLLDVHTLLLRRRRHPHSGHEDVGLGTRPPP